MWLLHWMASKRSSEHPCSFCVFRIDSTGWWMGVPMDYSNATNQLVEWQLTTSSKEVTRSHSIGMGVFTINMFDHHYSLATIALNHHSKSSNIIHQQQHEYPSSLTTTDPYCLRCPLELFFSPRGNPAILRCLGRELPQLACTWPTVRLMRTIGWGTNQGDMGW